MSVLSQSLNPLTLPLCGTSLIEASAGTGKTYTITILYVRLILNHLGTTGTALPENLLPPQILVVTFTDAATKELRDRIRTTLSQAASIFGEKPGEPARETNAQLLYDLRNQHYPNPEMWPACRQRLLLAAEWMDEASISTIHSWCNRMLSEHAFDSGSLFKLTLEKDQSELLDEAARDYWRTYIYPLPDEYAEQVLSNWKTPAELAKAVKPLLPLVDTLGCPDGEVTQILGDTVTLRSSRLAEIKSPWIQWHAELTLFVDATQNFKKSADKLIGGAQANSIKKVLDLMIAWAEGSDEQPEGLIQQTPLAGYGHLSVEGMHKIWKHPDVPFNEHSAMVAISKLADNIKALPDADSLLLKHAAGWIAQRLEMDKQRRSVMGFDDLLTHLDRALHGSQGDKLAKTIRTQFPAVLIDEFQDTDPTQYKIFSKIYPPQEQVSDICLLMIGDPKQAIYSFRGADIFTYLQAREAVENRIYKLGMNFRSTEYLIKGVNRVFERADKENVPDGAFLFGAGNSSALPFHPVTANGTQHVWSVNGAKQTPLTFWTLDGVKDEKGKFHAVTKKSYQQVMAAACANEIGRYLSLGQEGTAGFMSNEKEWRPVKPGDFAILVNNRGEANAVREALEQRQIKSVYLSDRDSVLVTPEAKEVLLWLRAFAEPRRPALARAALASPTLTQSYQSLDLLLTNEVALEREINRFIGYQKMWQTQGVLPMLHRFLMDFAVPQRLLSRPDGERRLTNILHLAELLQRDSDHLDGEHSLVHHYAQMLRTAKEDDELHTIRLESDAGLVKVITVHKSKGLEFPLVFLPFASAFRAVAEKDSFVVYHDEHNQRVTVFDPNRDDVAKADRERLGEDIRKCYVAMTRARYAMWVGVAATDQWMRSGLGYLIKSDVAEEATLSDHLQGLISQDHADCIAIEAVPEATSLHLYKETETESIGPAMRASTKIETNWRTASYSAIAYTGKSGSGLTYQTDDEDRELQNLLEDPDDKAIFTQGVNPQMNQHSFKKGSGPGSFLHEILEWCAKEGFSSIVDSPNASLRQLLEDRCKLWGWGDWVDVLEGWITRIITAQIPLPSDKSKTISLKDLGTARPEMEFLFESNRVDITLMDEMVTRLTLGGADRPQVRPDIFNGMLKGFIDLIFEHDGRYYVLDYKSNVIGPGDDDYTHERMANKILENRYDLQYVIYLLALHRLLKARLPDYDYDQHVGGAIYLFLRGCDSPGAGAFVDQPPRGLIEQLDALFDGVSVKSEIAA